LRRYHVREHEAAGLIATETRHPPRFKLPSHSHDLPSFYLVLEGALTEIAEHTELTLNACTVVFTPPGHVHRNTFHDRGGRCLLVELTPSWKERFSLTGAALDRPLVTRGGELAYLGTRLYREFRHLDAVSPFAAEGIALEILAALIRQPGRPDGRIAGWLGRARDLLHDRFADRLELAEIAGAVGVHPVHLARTFRKQYQCTPGEYQRKLRVQHAARELTTSRRAVAEIALSCGFADQAHFSRVFKRWTGWTPARYRDSFGLG
jgi:AraC family transcriptional regulator